MIRAKIRYATKNPNGRVSYRDDDTENRIGQFVIGRHPESDIFLRDLVIHDREATITVRESDVIIESLHPGSMHMHGLQTDRGVLSYDSQATIGPYTIGLLPPEGESQVIIGVEHELPAPEAALAKLLPSGRQDLSSGLIGKRSFAWLFFLALAVICFVLPVAGYIATAGDGEPEADQDKWLASFDSLWVSGELSDAHKFLNDRCEDCHIKPFIPVEDSACTECHATTEHHFDTQLFTISDAAEGPCTGCHGEHQGSTGSIPTHQSLCTDCHINLDEQEPETTLLNASDFGFDHPEFRPSVIVDPATLTFARVELGSPDFPKENSNLKFPHNIHIGPDTKDTIKKWVREMNASENLYEGREELVCADCHVPDPGGATMAKVNMSDHCAACHRLEFDQQAKGRVVPHGQPAEVIGVIEDFYVAKALRRLETSPQPAAQQGRDLRQRAGANPSEDAVKRATLQAAQDEVDRNLAAIFGDRLCSQCHNVISPQNSASGEWEVAPVYVTRLWEPKAVFDHQSHTTIECGECHNALVSETSADVLLPRIESCRQCHEGEAAEAALPSTCGMCHVYHIEGLEPLGGTTANADPHRVLAVATERE